MPSLAKFLVITGVVFLIAGGLVFLISKTGTFQGRLPGDVRLQFENFTCFIALGTSILLSILLTLILNIVARFLNR